MERMVTLLVLAGLLIAGCIYEAPITTEHVVPIDKDVLGMWQLVPEEGEDPDPDEKMLVLKYSDTEYLIRYPCNDEAMYFRAYPIKVGGLHCIQVELIGQEDGSSGETEKERYCVFSYTCVGNRLTLKDLNTELLAPSIKSSEELREAFIKHKAHKDLFTDPDDFMKIEKKANKPDAGDGK